MKFLSLLTVVALSASGIAADIKSKSVKDSEKTAEKTPVEMYAGLILEGITQTKTEGTEDRDGRFGFGLQGMAGYKNAGLGLSYRYFKDPKDGNSTVNVEQSSHWLLFDGAYRFMPESTTIPYVFVGVGPIFKSVTTTFMSQSETHQGSFFSRSVGGGCMIKAENNIALNFALRYYQYEAVNGFLLTLGAGIDFLSGLKF